MDPKIKAEWLKALRSRKYQQAQGSLATDEGFCCLGVLYDVAFDGWWIRDVNDEWETDAGGRTYLTGDQRKYVGLIRSEQNRLAKMNDTGATFAEIADYIEKHL